jgi:hypothetical protein
MVTGTASPDDPTLTEYWANRRRRTTRLLSDRTSLRLLTEQYGQRVLCGQLFLHAGHPPKPQPMGTVDATSGTYGSEEAGYGNVPGLPGQCARLCR